MRSAALPMYSSVTGDRVGPNAIDAAYWWRNVREPVKFDAAIRAMLDAGVNTFVEIGPRAVLTTYLTEIIKPLGAGALVLPSLTRKMDGGERLSTLAMQLELSGGLRDRARLFPVPGRYVDLPHYPWQRERHWHSSTSESQGRLARRVLHPLLGFASRGMRCTGKIMWTWRRSRSMPIMWSAAARCCRPRDSSRWRLPPASSAGAWSSACRAPRW